MLKEYMEEKKKKLYTPSYTAQTERPSLTTKIYWENINTGITNLRSEKIETNSQVASKAKEK